MRLRLDPTLRIFESASKTPGRYAMHGVFLRLVDGVPKLSATDGHILATVDAVIEDDTWPEDDLGKPAEFLLDANALRAGWKGGATRDKFLAFGGGEWKLIAEAAKGIVHTTAIPEIVGEFPDTARVVPESSAMDERVTLNVAYLVALAKATGGDTITLSFPAGIITGATGYGSPVVVTPGTIETLNKSHPRSDASGVIMPVNS